MAALFDAVGPSTGTAASATAASTLSWTHTCTGSNRLLVVGVAVGVNPDTGYSVSVTYAGTTMTPGPVVHSGGTAGGFVQMFSLVAPATGANTVAVTVTGGTATLTGGSVSYTAAGQSAPLGTPVTAYDASASTAVSVTLTGATAGNPIVDVLAQGSGVAVSSAGSGQTIRWQGATDGATRAGGGASSTKTAAGGTDTVSYTLGAADHWAIAAVEVLPYVPPGPARPVAMSRQPLRRASLR